MNHTDPATVQSDETRARVDAALGSGTPEAVWPTSAADVAQALERSLATDAQAKRPQKTPSSAHVDIRVPDGVTEKVPPSRTPSVAPGRPILDALTGLRLFLALNIMNYHFGLEQFKGAPAFIRNIADAGHVGVNLFFVMTGFILSYVYLDAKGARPLNARRFWIARFSRLYPVYLLGLLLWLPFLPQKIADEKLTGFTIFGVLLSVPSLTQAWFPGAACQWNCPGWSASTDAFFYLVFPLVAAFLYPRIRFDGPWKILAWVGGLWLASLVPPALYMFAEATGEFVGGYHFWLAALKYHPLARTPEFLIGVVLGKYFLTLLERGPISERWGRAGTVAVGAVFLVLSVSPIVPYPLLHNGLLLPLFAVIVLGLASGRGALTRFLSIPRFVRLGEASYCLYILHNPVWEALYRSLTALGMNTDDGHAFWFYALYAVVAVGLSSVAFHSFEVPMRELLRAKFDPTSGARAASGIRPPRVWPTSLPTSWRGWPWGTLISGAALVVGLLNLALYGHAFPAQRLGMPSPPAVTASIEPQVVQLIDPRKLEGGLGAAGWRALSGEWKLEGGALTQKTRAGFDHLAYSTTSLTPPYTLRAQFRAPDGGGAGLSFNAPDPGTRNGAQVVRYSDDGKGLLWGQFDARGEYVNQGSASLKPEQANLPNSLHALEIEAEQDAYTIRLDGAVIASDVPLISESGHAGLQSSVGTVAFDALEVRTGNSSVASKARAVTPSPSAPQTAVSTDPPPAIKASFTATFERQPLDAGWIAVGGDWALEGSTYVQRRAEGYDQGLFYNQTFGAPYVLHVRLRHTSGSGGGAFFNAAQAGSKNASEMVRFTDDGHAVAWGSYDANGAFAGQGSAPVPVPGQAAHDLEINVSQSAFTLKLDDRILAKDVAFQARNGYIGLQTSMSAVAFEAVEVKPEAK